MLVLSRRPGEEIIINDNIKVTVVSIKGDRIRIGIEAPPTVSVDRAEVHDRRTSFMHDLEIPVMHASHEDTGVHPRTLVIKKDQLVGV